MALAAAPGIGVWLGDIDGDGKPEIVLAPRAAPPAGAQTGRSPAEATAAAPSADQAVVLGHDASGGLVVAASNAGFDLSQAKLIAELTAALLTGDIAKLTSALTEALVGATCSLSIAVVEFLADAAKLALLAEPDLVSLISGVFGGAGFDGDEFAACLPTAQTVMGCVFIGFAAHLDVRKHCYQVSDGTTLTTCTNPPARLPLCTKAQGACCNRALAYKVLLSSIKNNAPNVLEPSDGQIRVTPRSVVLGGPFSTPDIVPLAGLLPSLAPEVCVLGALLDTRNPIEVSAQPADFCATNVTKTGHIFIGNVKQCVSEDETGVYSVTIGTSALPGVSDDPQRLATVNELLGPPLLAPVVASFKQQVADAMDSCGDGDIPAPPATVGSSFGDPHDSTFEGLRLDPQGVGEFVMANDTVGGFAVQVRTAPWLGSISVARNVAIAARIGGDIVAWYNDGTVRINQDKMVIATGRTQLAGGDLYRHGSGYALVWADGSQLRIQVGPAIAFQLYVSDARSGRVTGLLASSSDGQLITQQGVVVPRPISAAVFYGTFLKSYRLTSADEMLLYYDPALHETTETFTDLSFPHQLVRLEDIPAADLANATSVCQALGVPPDWESACVIDYVSTDGDVSVAGGMAGAPKTSGAIEIDTAAAPLTGATAKLSVRTPTVDTPISTLLTAVIDSSVEFPSIQSSALPGKSVAAANVDIGGSTIDLQYLTDTTLAAASFNGYVVSFVAPGLPAIRGMVIDPMSSADLLSTPVTFDASNIYINVSGRQVTSSSRLKIDLLFTGDPMYHNDFENVAAAGAEWSRTAIIHSRGTAAHPSTGFLGEFSNDSATLTLANLAAHTWVTLSFDLYIIQSWDGNFPTRPVGPDVWDLSVVGGATLLHTTFANENFPQAYPDTYPGGVHPAHSGASEINTLGYIFDSGILDSVYHLSFTFPHSASDLALTFSGIGLESLGNESWGLDNVSVNVQ